MDETGTQSLFAARIVTTPFVYPDGQIDTRAYVIENPQSVELDGAWVHVVEYDSLGSRSLIASYPAHEVQRVEWRKDYEA